MTWRRILAKPLANDSNAMQRPICKAISYSFYTSQTQGNMKIYAPQMNLDPHASELPHKCTKSPSHRGCVFFLCPNDMCDHLSESFARHIFSMFFFSLSKLESWLSLKDLLHTKRNSRQGSFLIPCNCSSLKRTKLDFNSSTPLAPV